MAELILQNETLKAKFDDQTGALTGLLSKATSWQINRRKKLGLSFRMMLPLEGKRNNQILGEKQSSPKVSKNADGSLTFVWNKLRSEFGGEHDITFTGTVKLTEFGLSFGGQLENRTDKTIEWISWPMIGDVTPAKGEKLDALHVNYGSAGRTNLFPEFQSHHGYYGVDCPINHFRFPTNPFILADSGKQGLYMGCHDPEARRMVTFSFELKPGFSTAYEMNTGVVPTTDTLDGHTVRVEFSAVRFPYTHGGETSQLQDIVLAPYAGTWHTGFDNYKAWRKTWFKRHPAPAWVKDVHSWQQYHVNSPEDELRVPYKDLVKYGEDCAKHGVQAIQLVGWNDGGQDRGNPSHDTDPRLGTWQDLKDAIAKCEGMGVRMILFNKYTWSDESLPNFHTELVKHAIKDCYGNYHQYGGYRYQTHTQLMDLNTRRLIPMCHCSKAWQEYSWNEFKKSIDLGASGMLYDESQHHGGAYYCFDASHGHHVPENVFGAGDNQFHWFLHEKTDPVKKDYLFAGETNYDIQFQYYHLTYTRINVFDHFPWDRYIDSDMEIMIAVTGFNDRLMPNRALMHRYIMSYEPFNFKGRLDDYPKTMKYGKQVDALRKKYRQYVWDAEYRDTEEATVKVGKETHKYYTVFRNADGKHGVIVANQNDKPIRCTVKLDGVKAPKWMMATPEKPKAQKTNGTVSIPAQSVVVLMEQ